VCACVCGYVRAGTCVCVCVCVCAGTLQSRMRGGRWDEVSIYGVSLVPECSSPGTALLSFSSLALALFVPGGAAVRARLASTSWPTLSPVAAQAPGRTRAHATDGVAGARSPQNLDQHPRICPPDLPSLLPFPSLMPPPPPPQPQPPPPPPQQQQQQQPASRPPPLPPAEVDRIITGSLASEYWRLAGTPGYCPTPLAWCDAAALVADGSEAALGRLGRDPAGVAVYWGFKRQVRWSKRGGPKGWWLWPGWVAGGPRPGRAPLRFATGLPGTTPLG